MKTNTEIRLKLERARKSGIYSYEVASLLGVSDVTFSKWLRRELTPGRKAQIMAATDRLIIAAMERLTEEGGSSE